MKEKESKEKIRKSCVSPAGQIGCIFRQQLYKNSDRILNGTYLPFA